MVIRLITVYNIMNPIVIPENNAIKTVPLDLSQMCARYCERNEQKRANCLQYFMELL